MAASVSAPSSPARPSSPSRLWAGVPSYRSDPGILADRPSPSAIVVAGLVRVIGQLHVISIVVLPEASRRSRLHRLPGMGTVAAIPGVLVPELVIAPLAAAVHVPGVSAIALVVTLLPNLATPLPVPAQEPVSNQTTSLGLLPGNVAWQILILLDPELILLCCRPQFLRRASPTPRRSPNRRFWI